ncbi:MAG TPA: hypothetical protein VFQ71_03710, partial [Gaiellales bacterium]|nr:hypothetical protein [Gaiellales bacterium]
VDHDALDLDNRADVAVAVVAGHVTPLCSRWKGGLAAWEAGLYQPKERPRSGLRYTARGGRGGRRSGLGERRGDPFTLDGRRHTGDAVELSNA